MCNPSSAPTFLTKLCHSELEMSSDRQLNTRGPFWGQLHEARLGDLGLHCASPLDCLNKGSLSKPDVARAFVGESSEYRVISRGIVGGLKRQP